MNRLDFFGLLLFQLLTYNINYHLAIIINNNMSQSKHIFPDCAESLNNFHISILFLSPYLLCESIENLHYIRFPSDIRKVVCAVMERPSEVVDTLILDLLTAGLARDFERDIMPSANDGFLFIEVLFLLFLFCIVILKRLFEVLSIDDGRLPMHALFVSLFPLRWHRDDVFLHGHSHVQALQETCVVPRKYGS